MSSADLLRRAAAKLREHAEAADWGPWEVGPSFGARDSRVYVRPVGGFDWIGATRIDDEPTKVMACQVSNMPRFRENAAYIALMHPPVALALAEWLAFVAVWGKQSPYADAVARAVLREDGESE